MTAQINQSRNKMMDNSESNYESTFLNNKPSEVPQRRSHKEHIPPAVNAIGTQVININEHQQKGSGILQTTNLSGTQQHTHTPLYTKKFRTILFYIAWNTVPRLSILCMQKNNTNKNSALFIYINIHNAVRYQMYIRNSWLGVKNQLSIYVATVEWYCGTCYNCWSTD